MRLTASLWVLPLLALALPSQAAVIDVANQQYAMAGEVKVKGVMVCGPVRLSGGAPTVMPNTFTMAFGAYGDIGGTFQISGDNIAPEGEVIDGDIFDRKRNKLTLKYASAATPAEAAGDMVALVQQKIKDSNSPLAEIPFTVKKYSFVAKVKTDKTAGSALRVTEKLLMTGPYKSCQAQVTMVRKVRGTAQVAN